jgi:hypothetical protein
MRHQGAAMPVAAHDKIGCRVLAEEREAGGMRAVTDRQHAAGTAGVGGITQCRLDAIDDVGDIDRIAIGKPGDRAAKGIGQVELNCAAGARVERDIGVGGRGEFELARAADPGVAGAIDGARGGEVAAIRP